MNITQAMRLKVGDTVRCPVDYNGETPHTATVASVLMTDLVYKNERGAEYIWVYVKDAAGQGSWWTSNRLGYTGSTEPEGQHAPSNTAPAPAPVREKRASELRSIDGEVIVNANSSNGCFTYAAQSVDGALALATAMRANGFTCDIRIWKDALTGYEVTRL